MDKAIKIVPILHSVLWHSVAITCLEHVSRKVVLEHHVSALQTANYDALVQVHLVASNICR